ncbi:hypothetical protein BDW59DRAFT_91036 [Aspergillus cavernicola]|uniref:SWIM-type domain-containing protein n=1 Tax=Aspergillus cavernicola TaxID=176166 RepID=A0ABR4IAC9_9EURO
MFSSRLYPDEAMYSCSCIVRAGSCCHVGLAVALLSSARLRLILHFFLFDYGLDLRIAYMMMRFNILIGKVSDFQPVDVAYRFRFVLPYEARWIGGNFYRAGYFIYFIVVSDSMLQCLKRSKKAWPSGSPRPQILAPYECYIRRLSITETGPKYRHSTA